MEEGYIYSPSRYAVGGRPTPVTGLARHHASRILAANRTTPAPSNPHRSGGGIYHSSKVSNQCRSVHSLHPPSRLSDPPDWSAGDHSLLLDRVAMRGKPEPSSNTPPPCWPVPARSPLLLVCWSSS